MKKSAHYCEINPFIVLLTPSGSLNCSLKGASTQNCDTSGILNQISRLEFSEEELTTAEQETQLCFLSIILWSTLKRVSTVSHLRDRDAHLLNSNRSFSKMRMGPVELRMMRGCPLKRQKTDPARAVPRKLSITPCRRRKHRNKLRMKTRGSQSGAGGKLKYRKLHQTSDETRGREGWRCVRRSSSLKQLQSVNTCVGAKLLMHKYSNTEAWRDKSDRVFPWWLVSLMCLWLENWQKCCFPFPGLSFKVA